MPRPRRPLRAQRPGQRGGQGAELDPERDPEHAPPGGLAAQVDADEEQPEQHGRDQGEQDRHGRAGHGDPAPGRRRAMPGRGGRRLVPLPGGQRGHGDPAKDQHQAAQGHRARPLPPGQVDQQGQHGPGGGQGGDDRRLPDGQGLVVGDQPGRPDRARRRPPGQPGPAVGLADRHHHHQQDHTLKRLAVQDQQHRGHPLGHPAGQEVADPIANTAAQGQQDGGHPRSLPVDKGLDPHPPRW